MSIRWINQSSGFQAILVGSKNIIPCFLFNPFMHGNQFVKFECYCFGCLGYLLNVAHSLFLSLVKLPVRVIGLIAGIVAVGNKSTEACQ